MKLRSLVLAAFLALPFATSFAQVEFSVGWAPPPLPVYEQPACPVEGYIWTPGYWGWNADYYDYNWVPGVWVPPPRVGLLWTPGWWGWNNGAYAFNQGYWGPHVGFYGGINYGYGYTGNGYWGGRWVGNNFSYNTYVSNVNKSVIHNTYVNRNVNKQVTQNRASFNGPNGVKAHETAQQKTAAANAKKMGPLRSSSSDRTQQSRIPIFKRRTTRATPATMRSNRLIRLTAKAQRVPEPEPELGREPELEKVKIRPGTSGSIRVREREMLNIALATWPNITARVQEPANLENTATSTRAKIRETSTPAKIRETGKTLEATKPKRTTNQWNIRVPVTGRMQ